MTVKALNIYGKLAASRKEFHQLKLEKTGQNKFAKYSYFELADFLIPALNCLEANGVVPVVSFSDERATLTLHETNGESTLEIHSPMKEANLKGCHPIQNLGAVETYQTRYLFVALMAIVEHDALDSAPLDQEEKPAPKKAAAKKPADKVTPIKKEDDPFDIGLEAEIADAESAERFVTVVIQQATAEHSDSRESLISFWKSSAGVNKFLSDNYPEQFERLKAAFGDIKKSLMEKEV